MKKFLLGFMCGALALSIYPVIATVTTYIAKLADFPVLVDGERINLDMPVVTIEGRTYLPLRAMGDILGVQVLWNEEKQQAEVYKDGEEISEIVLSVDGEDFNTRFYNYFMYSNANDADKAYDDMMGLIITAKTAEKAGLAYDDTTMAIADSFRQQILRGYPSPQQFYEESKTNERSLLKIMQMMALRNIYLQQLIQDGVIDMSEEVLEQIFESRYIKAKHILFSTIDTETNSPLTQEEVAKKEQLAAQVLKQIKAGEDFDTLMNEHSDDPGLTYNPEGYVFTAGDMVMEFEEASVALEPLQVSDLVKTNYGYHIIKRMPVSVATDEQSFKGALDRIQNTIVIDYLEEKIPEWTKEFTVVINGENP